MKEHLTVVTRKGQVTIPAEIRRALALKEGDTVVWSLEVDQVRLQRSRGVVARTAGILKSKETPRTTKEERAATERIIADEVIARSRE
jgi:AbrB family looped-hinge helix DNA binding protein